MEANTIQCAAESVLHKIEALRQSDRRLLIAIDGRCAAGKTTLAAHLQMACECNVIHMDHFFLRPEQRTAQRLSEPGGNVDYERFMEEVLVPLKRGEAFSYRPYDCVKKQMSEAVRIGRKMVSVIEGSYSCHPELFKHYDLRIFLTVNETEQLRRIKLRNGEAGAAVYRDKWIPLEERYFSELNIEKSCDLRFDMGEV